MLLLLPRLQARHEKDLTQACKQHAHNLKGGHHQLLVCANALATRRLPWQWFPWYLPACVSAWSMHRVCVPKQERDRERERERAHEHNNPNRCPPLLALPANCVPASLCCAPNKILPRCPRTGYQGISLVWLRTESTLHPKMSTFRPASASYCSCGHSFSLGVLVPRNH